MEDVHDRFMGDGLVQFYNFQNLNKIQVFYLKYGIIVMKVNVYNFAIPKKPKINLLPKWHWQVFAEHSQFHALKTKLKF